jgi:hypothetical protein
MPTSTNRAKKEAQEGTKMRGFADIPLCIYRSETVKLSISHAATLLAIANGSLRAYSVAVLNELISHEPPLVMDFQCPERGCIKILTKHGQFVVSEMLNAMDNAT